MAKVLVLDGLSEEGVKVFEDEGFEVDVKPPQSPEDLKTIIGYYDGLVVRSATKVTADVFEAVGNLKVIGRAGVGTDNIDKAAATEKGVVVMNTPGGNTISTCEHAFALLFGLCRNIPAAHQSMQEGRWDRKKFMGSEVKGKTLGIIGLGRIGGAVAKRAQSFGMRILAFDPIMTEMKAEALGVELVTLDTLYENADFITIHAPKSDKTNNLIRLDQLKKMKPTCRIVNCARGGIVNEQDLAQALKEGIIAGAALDVYTSEPFEDNPFIGLDNILMTPHLAASTDEAQLTVAVEVAQQMAEYLKTGAIVNAVNVPSLDAETREALRPLLFLAERLGEFQSQYVDAAPTEIEIDYAGDLGVTDVYPVTTAVISGFLKSKVESVNMVSAPSQLKGHGIEISERRSAAGSDYAMEIGVVLHTPDGKRVVKGTLFNGSDPRICSIDGRRVDATPEGYMLVCANDDVPRVLGNICTVIGESGVNIANLTLGRESAGGKALTVVNLDAALSDETLDALRALEYVTHVGMVAFTD